MNSRQKNILVDIGHPAHVHLFRNFTNIMKDKGHRVYVLAKNVESIIYLLQTYNIPYAVTEKKPDFILWKYFVQIRITLKTLRFVRRNKIDIGIGSSMTLSMISKLTNITTFGLDDDDTLQAPIAAWFLNKSDYVLTPEALSHEHRGKHHIIHPSYHELAYLHPNRFTPDPSILTEAGLEQDEPYFVLRFNAFKAHHDMTALGLCLEQKRLLVQLLTSYGKVFITGERQIEPEFESHRLNIPPEKIHSFLFYASLFAGDSQTMTTEAALLGTPAFKCNSFAGHLSIPNEIENKYQLCFSYLPENFDKMLLDIKHHLEMPGLKKIFALRREKILHDKIDLTDFLVQLIEEYPQSVGRNTSK